MRLYRSDRSNKKYYVLLDTGRRIYFGDPQYEDYTTHKDKERRERYWTRHARDHVRISRENIVYPGFWSWHVLWGPTTSAQRNFQLILQHVS